jgi:uncharacterized protein (DUF1778 family)
LAAKGPTHIAARRQMGRSKSSRHGAKVFSYYTEDEKDLLDRAAAGKRMSLSAYVASASLDQAERDLDLRKK